MCALAYPTKPQGKLPKQNTGTSTADSGGTGWQSETGLYWQTHSSSTDTQNARCAYLNQGLACKAEGSEPCHAQVTTSQGPLKPHRLYSHCRLAALARSDSFPLGGSHLPPASSTICQQIPVALAGAPAKVHTRAGAQQAQAARHIPPRNMGAPEKGGGRAGEQCCPQLVKDHKSYARGFRVCCKML